jgi:lipopolysaccharide/colanic/teichoic acid biosynthesis glycosyltransferase
VSAVAAAPARTAGSARRAKRAFDVVFAAAALLALVPLLVLVALAIRLDSRGPVLFRQRRIGRGGRPFRLWKFRTMSADAEQREAALWALSRDPGWLDLDEDPRVTRVGRALRRASLDELPQFVNVLRGHMSLVGPRPLLPAEHARMPAWARCRDEVLPGLTGLWQVSGRALLSFEAMLRLDCVYVATWSLRRDLGLLVRTVPAVLTGKGAT